MNTEQSAFSAVLDQPLYRDCANEQIHLLGHIQSHGVLMAIDEASLAIVQISDNTKQFFDVPTSAFINQPLSKFLPKTQIDVFSSFVSQQDLEIFNPIKITIQVNRKKHYFQGLVHRSDSLLILELELLSNKIESNFSFYHLAKSSAMTIRKAQSFEEITEMMVKEVRKITQYDRVLIYRFDQDNSGIVIAEDKVEHLSSLLGLHYPAFDIPDCARQLYCKNWLRLIVDLNSQPIPIVPVHNPLTQTNLDLSFSSLRSVSSYHAKYLQKMGVSASLGISLINADKLWGLVVCHHYEPKYLDYEVRKTCEFLAQIMSIEIVNKYEQSIKNSHEKIKSIQSKLKKDILDTDKAISYVFTKDLDNLLNLVNAQGAVISLGDSTSNVGVCPSEDFVEDLIVWLSSKSHNPDYQDIFYTNSLSHIYPEALNFKDQASGILSISISLNHTSYHIIWFRPEIIQTVNWAGDPSKLVDIDVDLEDLSPRRSFELWKETVRYRSLPWSDVEIEAALGLRSTLMLAALEFSQQALKEEAKRAEIASQAKSSFLARMSHELRTPLNAILGCTQLIHHETGLPDNVGEYVNIISHSSEHLLNLIDDVLEMSKIEAGKLIIQETEFLLPDFFDSIQEMLQMKAKDKNLQLVFVLHPKLPLRIKADDRKIRQIILNLLGNAIKFTSQGYVILRSSLEITDLVTSKSVLHIEVEDSGQGIAPEELDTLFQPFVQTSSGRKSQTGTGLGLVISQQFAQCMGGNITATSVVGRGTTFKLDIPIEILDLVNIPKSQIDLSSVSKIMEPAKQRVVEEITSRIEQHPSPEVEAVVENNCLRVLLAEDNTFNQLIALRLLAKLGYQADCAITGVEVLKAIECKHYDLILMDVQMPDMDGLEATRQIRLMEKNLPDFKKIKIVAMTANAMQEDREKCQLYGMDNFISKPIRIADLARVLKLYQR